VSLASVDGPIDGAKQQSRRERGSQLGLGGPSATGAEMNSCPGSFPVVLLGCPEMAKTICRPDQASARV
jgi:hypothetical protein